MATIHRRRTRKVAKKSGNTEEWDEAPTDAAGKDFYSFVNHSWHKRTEIPSYVSSFGVSEEIEDRLNTVLWREIESCLRGGSPSHDALEKAHRSAIGIFAKSCLDPAVQFKSIDTLKRLLSDKGGLTPCVAAARRLGKTIRLGIPTLLDFSVDVKAGGDKQRATDYLIYIDAGRFGLPSLEYYKSARVSSAYVACIDAVCKKLNLGDSFSPAIRDEVTLWKALDVSAESGLESKRYTWPALRKAYPHIPWVDLMIAYGCNETLLKGVLLEVGDPLWLEVIDKLFKEEAAAVGAGGKISCLLALHTLVHALPFLPPPFDTIHSAFFEGVLEGQEKKYPQRVLALETIKEFLADSLAYLYVKSHIVGGTHPDPDFKGESTQFVRTLVAAAAKAIKNAKWISESATAEAERKLASMRLSVGYSTGKLREPPTKVPLRPDTFLENIYQLQSEKVDRRLLRLKRGVPADYWDEPPFLVNAYYYHSSNEIVIPAANFCPPFYKRQGRGGPVTTAWNYGGLGAAIAHEITHAFDSQGQGLNSRGRKRIWWSRKDRRHLKHRQARLVDIYSAAGVNGKATLDENIADLGGLEIALEALKGGLGPSVSLEALRSFFTSYAVSWRTEEKAAKKKQRLLADKHSPVEERVNRIVSQFDEWYDAFDVKSNAALYRSPRSRLHLFRE